MLRVRIADLVKHIGLVDEHGYWDESWATALSQRTGIPRSTFYSLERGDRGAGSQKTVPALMRAFPELSFEEIFETTDYTNVPAREAVA